MLLQNGEKDGININVVCPLVMTKQLEQWKAEYPELFEKTIQGIPLQRFGDAEKRYWWNMSIFGI